MSGSQLNTLLAALVTSFTCQTQSVHDFTGLEYFTGLTSLTINNTPATRLPSLSGMTLLTSLNCSGNQLAELPDLSSNLLLLSLNCSNNQLTSIPDVTLLTSLTSADFRNNRLTFEDFLPSVGNPVFNTAFLLSPQDSIAVNSRIEVLEGSPLHLSLNIDKGLSSNKYIWYKDGVQIQTNTSSDLNMAAVKKTDEGIYLCVVTNNSIPALTLTTNKVWLVVKEQKQNETINEITPDGDGVNDNYYIPDTGVARIYDRNGKLVKKLSVPGTWDGTGDNNETVTTGFYLIEINGQTHTKIYLFR